MAPGMSQTTRAELTAVGPSLTLCVIAWIAFSTYTSMTFEDALITFRYAENLATGHGFVYNPGERVLGTTTPLLTLILGALGALLGPASIPRAAHLLMLLAAAGSHLLIYFTLRRIGVSTWGAAAAALVAGLHPAFLWATGSGMETPLVILLMAASLHAAVRDRWHLAMATCALLVLTRIDGLVWSAIVAATAIVRLRGSAWRPLLTGCLIAAPWFAFSWAYFGSLLPHSMIAKQAIGDPTRVHYAEWFASSLWLTNPIRRPTGEMLLWFGLVVAGVLATVQGRWRPLAPLAWFPLLFMAFLFAGRAPRFPWYMTPAAWCVAVLAVVGTIAIAERIGRRTPSGTRWALALAAVCWLVIGMAVARRDLRMAEYARVEQANEVGLRQRVGEWLDQRAPADAAVAMEAVGYQGTHARRRIIDLAGLISPEVVEIHRQTTTNADALARVLQELRPDFLVLRSFEVESNRYAHGGRVFEVAAQRDSFMTHYREAGRFEAPYPQMWGENARLTVWARAR
jgi:hypothetical protein